MTATARSHHASASRKLAIGLLSAALLTLLPTLALAKKSDRDLPMNYVAKTTNAFNAPNTVTTLTGNVKITQGSLLVTGDVAKMYLDADTQIARIVVTGNLAHIQQLDENNQLVQGDAVTLDYDNINGIAVLTTRAQMKQQGRGEFHGEKLTYNTNTQLITGESSGDGLVHGIILPKPKPAATAPQHATTPAATKPASATAPDATPAPSTSTATHGQP
ncbi:lipopolysaccharide transport periplasmic protein LptA [Rhodanobacter sp. C03]|uniref:lipopolysaccharide transport periplasmic protein LptA n=1 Tax=Rhodanobacter sp. C03 TaxID=1945858 RepID=UPI0009877FB3|nr:lipopolysaccharide transport periplasmic protein LptA [Rhodanobacter sp. C03]OOG54426.1 lipopolysaccharide transport periplasmic protein LptA [Rhodanobacter sp. C03]